MDFDTLAAQGKGDAPGPDPQFQHGTGPLEIPQKIDGDLCILGRIEPLVVNPGYLVTVGL